MVVVKIVLWCIWKVNLITFFGKMESSDDSDSSCYIRMENEGDAISAFPKTELNESLLNRTKR